MEMPLVLDSRQIYKGWLRLRVDRVRLPSGKEHDCEVVELGSGVGVLAFTAEEQTVLVRQWRHPVGQYIVELPGGGRRKGETPLEAAQRELREETGYRGGAWTHIGTFYTAPGFSSLQVDLFIACGVTPGESSPDEAEEIEVVLKPAAEFIAEWERGEITDWQISLALQRFMKSVREAR